MMKIAGTAGIAGIGRRSRAKAALLAFTALAGAGGLAQPALAQGAAAENAAAKSFQFDIPAQSLSRTLTNIASTAGLQVFFPEDGGASGVTAPAIRGRMTADHALAQATAGTGFVYRYARPGVVTLVKASTGGNDEEVVTGVVSVEGLQGGSPYFGGAGQAAGVNGVNGSRDITATEGTGSFTSGALTIGSKVPQALKDVPQSISVLTSERLEQQNITDLTTVMKRLPGVTVTQYLGGSSLDNTFYSRGFEITNIQVDGGAPLSMARTGFFPQIDMSVYDHVELLRGADGLFDGYGNPAGAINLVRKKPLDHAQFTMEAQAGSWSNYRIVTDATAPLALDGRLRGRLVMTWQDNHYFYDLARDNKTLIYGIAEFDLTPTTLITGGINYSTQNSTPWYGGLPRYYTGDDIGLPRSTSFVFPWNRQSFKTREIFGGVEQKLGGEWSLKLNVTQNSQTSTQKLGYSNGAVNPVTGLGPALNGRYNDYSSDQLSTEAVLAGAFEILGQRQEVTFGFNRVKADMEPSLQYTSIISSSAAAPYQPYPGGTKYCYTTSLSNPCPAGTVAPNTPPIDVFNFDPNDPIYSEPANSLPALRYLTNTDLQMGGYMNLRLTAFDRLHLTTGLRWSRYEWKSSYVSICATTTGSCAGMQIGDEYSPSTSGYSGTNFSWPPPVNLSFDVTKQLTAYVGYTDIYVSQAYYLDIDQKPLSPITGSNWEAGVKWSPRDGKVNFSIAAYRINQHGFGTADGAYDDNGNFVASNGQVFPNYGQIDPNHTCCYKSDTNQTLRSQGIDAEVTGEVLPGWQVSASYTYSDNKQIGTIFGTGDSQPFVSIQPKQLYKLWLNYDFMTAGRSKGLLSGLSLSAGLSGQSSGYRSGTGCKPEFIVTNVLTGAATCPTAGRYTYAFTVPAYAILSARIDYRLSDQWSLAANFDNLLDKTYYQSVGNGPASGNWYGAPRSFTASLRGKW
ncbi:MAG: TonB-dependent receptor [Candidatus Andeanibacterium colombiense]|uniref:TonB-dependent receptor n=1 Tax=Candidatus Andeanibacterium colombiense TaxID=3121345 RepID=A0AAJ6BL94_9SPHN|nr:MAG: TonB-dependent receptor [Sphingomonadaceae bacterium]